MLKTRFDQNGLVSQVTIKNMKLRKIVVMAESYKILNII